MDADLGGVNGQGQRKRGNLMSTVEIALLFIAGVVAICGLCIVVAAIIHKTGLAERLWK